MATLKRGWLVRTRTYMEHGRLVTETLPADHEDEPCDVCEQDWCSCDDARDLALAPVRVSPLANGWLRAAA